MFSHCLVALSAWLLCVEAEFIVTVFQPQMLTLTPTKADQLAALQVAAQNASAAGSNLLMVPELYLTGYNLAGILEAEPSGGPSFQIVQKIASQNNVSIVFTYPELDPTTLKVYDSAALIYRNGSVLAQYRKVNLAAGEGAFLTAGDGFAPVVDVDGVRVGLLICFDVFLPEPARILALRRVQFIAIPTANGYPAGIDVLSTVIVPARAIENNAVVAYVNWVQQNATFPDFLTFHGQSAVSDNGGNLLLLGPSAAPLLTHISIDMSGTTSGSTALSRPYPDVVGLCNNSSVGF